MRGMAKQATPSQSRAARNKPSHTAAKVARAVVFLARDPLHASLLPEGAAESLESFALASGALKPWMCRLFDNPLYRKSVFGIVGSLWSGELMRVTLRKRFVDDEARAAVSDGARQVLVVGAGYDTLGLRMAADHPDVLVAEVDTPATAARRNKAITELSAARSNHIVVSADLGNKGLGEVLDEISGWSTELQTVVLAEGVVMYLEEKGVLSFLSAIRNNCGLNTSLIFSYLLADESGRPLMGRLSGLSRLSLKLVGEPLRWGVQEGELETFLNGAGFRLLGPPGRYDLGERYLRPEGIDQAVGSVERFAVAACNQRGA